MEKTECIAMNQDCVMQHIICFQKQAQENKKTDFGEPCQTCKHASECEFDWFKKISKALPNATIKIRLAQQAQQDIQDSDHIHPQPDMDIHQHNRTHNL